MFTQIADVGDCINPVFWWKMAPTKIDDTTYTVTMQAPESGWRAFYMEVEFKGASITNFLVSTQIVIIPNTWPFEPCVGAACYGTLV